MRKLSRSAKIILLVLAVVVGGAILSMPKFLSSFMDTHTPFEVRGEAMTPNYKAGQYWLSENHSTGQVINRGDVLVHENPKDNSIIFIKRVIGLPGDIIRLQDGEVYLNGEKIVESYINGTMTYGGEFLSDGQTVTVPTGNYFFMGDNRPYSSDSRSYGFVLEEMLVSKLTTCYKGCDK